jgi:hypothetical protein
MGISGTKYLGTSLSIMSAPLLRILKRLHSLFEETTARVREVEFRNKDGSLDLSPSVYKIDMAESSKAGEMIVRLVSEHYACWRSPPPPAPVRAVDIAGLSVAPLVPQNPNTVFAFLNASHRELRVGTNEGLTTLVEAMSGLNGARLMSISDSNVMEYIYTRHRDQDPEWTLFFTTSSRGRKWKSHAVRHGTYQSSPRP